MIRKHDDFVGSLIHDVAHLIRVRIDRKLKTAGITRVKWLALGVLQSQPMLTQGELAAELEIGDAACGRLVDRLEDRNLIERHKVENDRRLRKLKLTRKAEDILESLSGVSAALRLEILEQIHEDDLRMAESVLEIMKANLKNAMTSIVAITFMKVEIFASESYGPILQSLNTL
ncbi:MAG: MarR family transcriptional regulator [Rhodobacteraceae bacterium]|nr:MarR family transcriptional regulator [Paracoccaceae bacterium]